MPEIRNLTSDKMQFRGIIDQFQEKTAVCIAFYIALDFRRVRSLGPLIESFDIAI